jgi:hypothetical protein
MFVRLRFAVSRCLRWAVAGLTLVGATALFAAEEMTLVLKDGRTLTGRFTEVAGIAESTLSPRVQNGGVTNTPILVVDDGLRRTFVHRSQIAELNDADLSRDVRIKIWQDVAERGVVVGRVGGAVRVTPFDEFGRRIYELRTSEGLMSVVQGITQITPLYAKVQGVRGGNRPIVWESSVATTSIPRETLTRILARAIKQDNVDARLQVVRLYLQSERYPDARDELAQIVKDFPERQDLAQEITQIRQLAAQSMLREIQLRANAGQHYFARTYLAQFPADGVDGETLQDVRERIEKYASETKRREGIVKRIRQEIDKIVDANARRLASEFAAEIEIGLNEETVSRLTSFERLESDSALSPDQKVALAVSGWIIGAAKSVDNFQSAISLAEIRSHIRQYLRDPIAANRQRAESELADMERATVENIAQILKLMKPPLDVPPGAERGVRTFELTIPGLPGKSEVSYLVQLPPEYDPLRLYPTIVALSDLGQPPSTMLDFWAGAVNPESGERSGQATRRGYIVVAPRWQEANQRSYTYSAREHQAVLGSLRDALRRFSINSDRVFLTGHGVGGDAVFDIALAHPDHWAGVMPIAGTVGNTYCLRYRPNGETLDWYVVDGELDGLKLPENAKNFLDYYMRPKFDLTVVEYLGRGYEPFGDELQRMFDWMGRDERRRRMPEKFEFLSMRPWDNYFWWVEIDGLPDRQMVPPSTWSPDTRESNVRPYPFEGERTPGGRLRVTANGSAGATVWLSPDLVDFEQPINVEFNNRSMSKEPFVKPNLHVILEDARTRADRQHPFWAKLTAP